MRRELKWVETRDHNNNPIARAEAGGYVIDIENYYGMYSEWTVRYNDHKKPVMRGKRTTSLRHYEAAKKDAYHALIKVMGHSVRYHRAKVEEIESFLGPLTPEHTTTR